MIRLLEGLEIQTNLPVDNRTIVKTLVNRDAISKTVRYIGMETYVTDEKKKYRLEEGIENQHWVEMKAVANASELVTDPEHLTVSQSEKNKWNGKADSNHNHNGTYAPASHNHTAEQITQDATHRFTTDTEKSNWNSKADGNHNHNSNYAQISHKHNWDNIDGKPGTFNPTSHNHSSENITSMNGYSKPSETSAIVSGDTLNKAIGKLEKALEGKQASGSYALTDHNHNGIYATNVHSHTANDVGAYTKGEVDSKLGGKANSTHSHSEYQPKGDYATTGHKHTEYLSSQGSVTVSGNLTVTGEIISNNNVTAYSDETVKKNLVLLDKSVLEKLKEVKFYNYEMINDPTERKRVGVKAQELEKLFPELVFVDSNNIKKVDYIGLNTYFNFAIQQLIRGE